MLDLLFNYWTCNTTSGKIYYNNLIHYLVLPYFTTRLRTSVCLLSIYYVFFYRESSSFVGLSFIFFIEPIENKKKKRVLRIVLTRIHTSSRSYCLSFSFFFLFLLSQETYDLHWKWLICWSEQLAFDYVYKKKGEKWFFFSIEPSRIINITSNKKKKVFHNKNKIKQRFTSIY